MKKLLFLFLLGILPLNFIVGNVGCYSTQNNNVDLVHNQRTIILKGKKENKTSRSPKIYSVEAFLENKVLSLNFLSELPSVVVTVTNVKTNDVISRNIFTSYIGVLPVDLSMEEVGNYKIEIVAGEYDLTGDFVLE